MKRKDLWSLFQPTEIKQTLAVVEEVFARQDVEALVDQQSTLTLIKHEAIRLICQTKLAVHSVREAGMNPEQVALTIIANALEYHLRSGEHQTRHGKLDAQGEAKLRLLNIVNKSLFERNYISKEELRDYDNEVRQELMQAG